MPRHDWETPRYANAAAAFQAGEQRVCKLCGARQRLVREYAWMRQISARWLPLVGRCPGAPSDAGRGVS